MHWHILRFDSLEAAKAAAGPDGVAAEAHGSVKAHVNMVHLNLRYLIPGAPPVVK
jgi:hypothetical protein